MMIMKMFLELLALLLVSSSVCAADKDTPVKTTTIVGRLENLDKTPFNMTTHITLNHQQFTTYSRADGGFALYNVPPGVHQLDIHNNNYHFGQVKIQLLENEMDAPKCLEYAYPGALKQVIAYPLVLRPHATYTYFEKRQGLSLFSILKNPMVIMMVISLGLMFLMPKMMEGLDPEEKARMKEQMAYQKDPTKMLSQMWGDITGAGAEEAKPTRRNRIKKE